MYFVYFGLWIQHTLKIVCIVITNVDSPKSLCNSECPFSDNSSTDMDSITYRSL